MHDDPIVAEVRRIRDQLAKSVDYDIKTAFDEMRKREHLHGARLVRHKPRQEAAESNG